MKKKYVYPAVFQKKGKGFFVIFPDFRSCSTAAASLEKAVVMAQDVLVGRIYAMLARKEALPHPSEIDALKGDRVMLIVADINTDGDKVGAPQIAERAENGDNAEDKTSAGDDNGDENPESGEAGERKRLEEALSAEKDKYLRLLAEYDNFRKRSFQDRENAAQDAVARALDEMLSVTDNFERALSADCADPNYKKGVEMIYSLFKDSLVKLGIVEIEALGKPFDPNFHNAVTQRNDENFGENTVCEVFQPGYTRGGRLIRCAMVAVANP
jgi:molecular chaperone GrpE